MRERAQCESHAAPMRARRAPPGRAGCAVAPRCEGAALGDSAREVGVWRRAFGSGRPFFSRTCAAGLFEDRPAWPLRRTRPARATYARRTRGGLRAGLRAQLGSHSATRPQGPDRAPAASRRPCAPARRTLRCTPRANAQRLRSRHWANRQQRAAPGPYAAHISPGGHAGTRDRDGSGVRYMRAGHSNPRASHSGPSQQRGAADVVRRLRCAPQPLARPRPAQPRHHHVSTLAPSRVCMRVRTRRRGRLLGSGRARRRRRLRRPASRRRRSGNPPTRRTWSTASRRPRSARRGTHQSAHARTQP